MEEVTPASTPARGIAELNLGDGSESLLFNKVFKPVSQNKTSHGSSHVLLKPRKPTPLPLARLGCTERRILRYLADSGNLAYQFRIADIVHGTGLSTKAVYSALRRLMARGIVVKRGRGVYALSDYVIDLFNNGYTVPLCVEPEEKPVDNLGGRGGVDVGGRGVLGGWGVLRGHVLRPGISWLGFFVVLYFIKLLVDWSFNVVYEHLVNVYGPWRLRVVMSRVRSLFSYLKYYSRQVVLGCHGQYNGSPGGFSPLTDCVDGAHYYERGLDDAIPGWLAVVLDSMFSIFKVYVKTPEEIEEGNPEYYQDLLRELGEPPPMPREFAEVGSLMRLIA
jgi:hypothetical protein